MVSYNKENIEISIEKIVNKGFGLGYHNGIPVFVYSGIPGDRLECRIIHKSRKVFFAKIIKVIEASPFRNKTKCSADMDCGGCDWLAIDYEKQLEFKQHILDEIFGKLNISKRSNIIPSDGVFHYRNKSFMPLGLVKNSPAAGIFAHRSHKIVTHEHCLIHPKIFDEIAQDFITYVVSSNEKIYDEKSRKGNLRHIGFRISNSGDQILVVIVTKRRKMAFTKQLVNKLITKYPQIIGIVQNINPDNTNVILGEDEKILFGQDNLMTNIGTTQFKLHYKSFFQVNYNIAEKLYTEIKNHIKENAKVIDAYCGIGSIGLFVADKAEYVWGIEENGNAISDARYNSQLNNFSNIEFLEGRVEDKIDDLVSASKADTLIVDPPRKGLDRHVVNTILKSGIKSIIYVSCDPTTQKRDVDLFTEDKYRIVQSKCFDMFPNTYHMENLMVLERI